MSRIVEKQQQQQKQQKHSNRNNEMKRFEIQVEFYAIANMS